MLVHWIWFAARTGLNDQAKICLLEHFHDAEDIYCAARDAFSDLEISTEAMGALLDKDLSDAEKVLEQCARKKIHMVTWNDPGYPTRLKSIADPPVLLYYKGRLPDYTKTAMIGVVGTRKASGYGMNTAKQMGYELGRCGGVVVTGMASGIDSMAAQGALDAGAVVIGVLGCGADRVYPASNRALYSRVESSGGCLMSEYPPGATPNSWHFPRRNRIISGMCNGVLVVEAPEKSGALITARCALEQGRDVFAVPGNLGVATCAGSNALMREGATTVTSGWDVLSEYAASYPDAICKDTLALQRENRFAPASVAQNVAPVGVPESGSGKIYKLSVDKTADSLYSGVAPLSANEQAILAALGSEARQIDDVIAQARIHSGAALAALTTLEMKGVIQTLPGRRVARK